ncbi:potassium transporter Trk [Microbacterium sp. SORGH_AS_0888]|uniref:potassium transporter Trk n=1 Tax=Microbacterium sp. SORGH_AS_0888 TaxID=3041791 RepID=UPI002781302A|nr:potassium transporter Trk [Microbacterium sp. SORGH_AS_0888]MDQ1130132.1 ABC-type Fe3+-siderophore transport system permease subunit [Microbacterium sp. SORGH_AS_0888]
MAEQPSEPRVTVEDHLETVRVRRVPRFGLFLVLGALLGVAVAGILTLAFHGTDQPSEIGVQYSAMQVFGFLALAGVAVGLGFGALVALVLDRTVGRRTREVRVDRERVRVEED